MSVQWRDGSGLDDAAAGTFAAALARRMPLLCLGFAAVLAVAWWTLAHVPLDQRPPAPPPAQQQTATSTACDCGDCGISDCEVFGDACTSCDCVAVPPGAVTRSLETAADRPTGDPKSGQRAWASLGLLVPLLVMLVWRRRR